MYKCGHHLFVGIEGLLLVVVAHICFTYIREIGQHLLFLGNKGKSQELNQIPKVLPPWFCRARSVGRNCALCSWPRDIVYYANLEHWLPLSIIKFFFFL